jgi:hypothetical protein
MLTRSEPSETLCKNLETIGAELSELRVHLHTDVSIFICLRRYPISPDYQLIKLYTISHLPTYNFIKL